MAGPLPASERKRAAAWGDTLAERIHARSRQYPAPGGTFAGPSIGCDLDAIERDRSVGARDHQPGHKVLHRRVRLRPDRQSVAIWLPGAALHRRPRTRRGAH